MSKLVQRRRDLAIATAAYLAWFIACVLCVWVLLWLVAHYTGVGWLWLWLWCYHVLAATLFLIPIVGFGRYRVPWARWHALALVLPFAKWAAGASAGSMDIAIEQLWYLTLAIPVAAIMRALVGRSLPGWPVSGMLLVALCGVGWALSF